MKDRIERLMNCMEEQKTDAVLVTDGCNMRYLSGFSGETGYLYISGKRKVILTDSRYTTQAKEESREFEVQEISQSAGYQELIGALMRADEIRSLGFEDQVMIYADAVKLQKGLPRAEWKGLGGALDELRLIKSEEELACIARAEQIGDEAFSHILNVLHAGMTELEVAVELESYMKRNGASALAFDTIAASGIHSAMPHADSRQREIYQVVLEAQQAALAVIREGITGAEVDRVARDRIRDAGYGEYFGHGLGHSVGLFIHEEPRLSPSGHTVLKKGMTETVEPGIYLPGQFGVRIVQNNRNAGTGQALFVVHRAAANPFNTSHIIFAAQITAHGVDAAINIFILRSGSPAHNGLIRHQALAFRIKGQSPLHIVDDIRHTVRSQAVDLLIA